MAEKDELQELYERHKKVCDMVAQVPTIQFECIKNPENILKFPLLADSLNLIFDAVYSATKHNMYGYLSSANNVIGGAYIDYADEEDKRTAEINEVKTKLNTNSPLFLEAIYHTVTNINFIINGGAEHPFLKLEDLPSKYDVCPTDTVISLCIKDQSYELVRYAFSMAVNPDIFGSITMNDPVANKFNYISYQAIDYLNALNSLKSYIGTVYSDGQKDIEANPGYKVEQAYYNLGMLMYPIFKGILPTEQYGRVFTQYTNDKPVVNMMDLADIIVTYILTGESNKIESIRDSLKSEFSKE